MSDPTSPESSVPFATTTGDARVESSATPSDLADEILTEHHLGAPKRRVKMPLILFVVTCLSTFWAGVTDWLPTSYIGDFRWTIVARWDQGLVYTGAVLAILLTHEMGHFVATVIHRIPASFPFFIPLPISPIGTMGAVIGMAGHRANRREMFDIGIAGPLAGLAVAFPVLWIGVQRLDLAQPAYGPMAFDCPWGVRLLLAYLRPELGHVQSIAISQVNPYFMAAWVGLLVTGLNMMPISQLDGGHVIYALLLKKGNYLARAFLLSAIAYIVLAEAYMWFLMVILVTLIGTDHPPTANDRIRLGWFRTCLGIVSLSIPFLCFPPRGLVM